MHAEAMMDGNGVDLWLSPWARARAVPRVKVRRGENTGVANKPTTVSVHVLLGSQTRLAHAPRPTTSFCLGAGAR
jgi:hypothetical protein